MIRESSRTRNARSLQRKGIGAAYQHMHLRGEGQRGACRGPEGARGGGGGTGSAGHRDRTARAVRRPHHGGATDSPPPAFLFHSFLHDTFLEYHRRVYYTDAMGFHLEVLTPSPHRAADGDSHSEVEQSMLRVATCAK